MGATACKRLSLTGFALVACLLCALAPALAAAQTTFVIDEADVLPADVEQRLSALGAQLERAAGGAQVAVLTVRSLGGRTIEEYSEQRFEELGVGTKEKNNGVLLVVSTDDRKVRIEVGYGLEGALPDARAGAIIDEALVPAFKAGDMPGGIEAGYGRIAQTIAEDAGVELTGVRTVPSSDSDPFPWILFFGMALVVFVIGIVRRLTRRSGSGSGGGPTWWSPSDGGSSGGDSGGGFGGGDSGGGGASGDW